MGTIFALACRKHSDTLGSLKDLYKIWTIFFGQLEITYLLQTCGNPD